MADPVNPHLRPPGGDIAISSAPGMLQNRRDRQFNQDSSSAKVDVEQL
jgi:hypothetical protein